MKVNSNGVGRKTKKKKIKQAKKKPKAKQFN